MKEIENWIWFSRIKIGARKKKYLLEHFEHIEKIKQATAKQLLEVKGIGQESIKEILKESYKQNNQKIQAYMQKKQIKLLTIKDKQYPYLLKQIYDSPIILYIMGNIELLNSNCLAIIGTRKNTSYGKIVTQKFTEELAKENITIVSGLAKGIDSYAHTEALKVKGNTIAVLAHGFDSIYPKENEKLAKEILQKGGTLVTEYPIGTKPEKIHFPARNRIISGLSKGVLVTEAKRQSGTMITIEFALEQGREVFTIPGNITSVYSEGTNELAKEGAKIVTRPNEIVEELKKNCRIKNVLL